MKEKRETRQQIINFIYNLTNEKINLSSYACGGCHSKRYFDLEELNNIRKWLLENLDMKKVIANKI